MRVVSYTRTTSCVPFEEVPADIIKRQNDHIQDFCKKYGYKISNKYSDRKHDADEETEFRELLSDGMKHKFDLVVVDSLYRAGSYLGSAKEVLCKTLCFSGVDFAVVEDDFISIGMSNSDVLSYVDSKYQEFYKLQKRQYAIKRIQDGIFTKGEAKYGFDVVDGKLVINEAEADVVRRIFNECVSGKSSPAIAKNLNSDNVDAPSVARGTGLINKNGWNPSGVRKILRNTLYRGDFERKYEEVIVRCSCEAIIPKALFDQAQKSIKSKSTGGDYSRKSVFSGMIKDIGDSIRYTYQIIDGVPVYKPSPSSECSKKYIPYEIVESLVKEFFKNTSTKALRIKKLIETEGEVELNKIRDDIAKRMRALAFRLAEIEKDRPDNLCEKRQEIENSFQLLENELETMEKAISFKNPWLVQYVELDSTPELTRENLKKGFKGIYFDKCLFDHFEFYQQNWYELLPVKWRM